jgi:hypothetical protein
MNIKTLLPELRKVVGDMAEELFARSTRDATINAGPIVPDDARTRRPRTRRYDRSRLQLDANREVKKGTQGA